ncbi:hypothetical protein LCGC14_1577530, partial [marine sediment metagenome]
MNTFLHTYAEVHDYFRRRDFKTCAFDSETSDLNYTKLQMVGCSFCNGETTCYINLNEMK